MSKCRDYQAEDHLRLRPLPACHHRDSSTADFISTIGLACLSSYLSRKPVISRFGALPSSAQTHLLYGYNHQYNTHRRFHSPYTNILKHKSALSSYKMILNLFEFASMKLILINDGGRDERTKKKLPNSFYIT